MGSLDRFWSMQRPESTTEMRRGGGEARAAAGTREEEDRERRIRKDANRRVKIKGEPNNGYPAI